MWDTTRDKGDEYLDLIRKDFPVVSKAITK